MMVKIADRARAQMTLDNALQIVGMAQHAGAIFGLDLQQFDGKAHLHLHFDGVGRLMLENRFQQGFNIPIDSAQHLLVASGDGALQTRIPGPKKIDQVLQHRLSCLFPATPPQASELQRARMSRQALPSRRPLATSHPRDGSDTLRHARPRSIAGYCRLKLGRSWAVLPRYEQLTKQTVRACA